MPLREHERGAPAAALAALPALQAAAAAPPHVYLNGRFLVQRVTGVQRYARETLHALDELLHARRGAGMRWTLLVPRGAAVPPLAHIGARSVGRLQGHAWEQIELPWAARGGWLLGFGFTGPLLKRRQIITVHDAAVVRMPQAYRTAFRIVQRTLVRHIAARAPCTMTVSQFSAREATACYGVAAERLRVAGEGWQHIERLAADESIIDAHGLRGRPYVLAVSSPTPNKNFAAIEGALALLGEHAPTCVVAGAAARHVFRHGGAVASPAMRHVGYVSDAQLKALYAHARCFVFPSFYEGFGIPPLEAMACGCCVVASTAPALREVCGDAALYVDPRRPEQLARALQRVWGDAALREQLHAAAQQRLARYSWRWTAEANLAAIEETVVAALEAGATGGVGRPR